jgi:hypothetical protein
MSEKEVHNHYSGGDGGGSALGMMVGIVLVACLVIGGIVLFKQSGGADSVAKAPSVSVTTGQGGK